MSPAAHNGFFSRRSPDRIARNPIIKTGKRTVYGISMTARPAIPPANDSRMKKKIRALVIGATLPNTDLIFESPFSLHALFVWMLYIFHLGYQVSTVNEFFRRVAAG